MSALVVVLCCGRVDVNRCLLSLRATSTASIGEQSLKMTWSSMKLLGKRFNWSELFWPNIYRNSCMFLILFPRKVHFSQRNYVITLVWSYALHRHYIIYYQLPQMY